jgi:hypothetical protein
MEAKGLTIVANSNFEILSPITGYLVVGFLLLGIPFGVVAARIARRKSLSVGRYFLLGEFLGIGGIYMAKKATPKAVA